MHKLFLSKPRKYDAKSGFFHENDPEYKKVVAQPQPQNEMLHIVNPTITIKCEFCSKQIVPKTTRQKFCTAECSRSFNNQKAGEANKRLVAHAR